MVARLVNNPQTEDKIPTVDQISTLASWVMARVESWRVVMDERYKGNWERYHDKWRGFYRAREQYSTASPGNRHTPTGLSRNSERSKLIGPQTLSAIDATVGELEEGLFAKGRWYDIAEGLREQMDPGTIAVYRETLEDEMTARGLPRELSKCILIGAVYGTSTIKLMVGEHDEKTIRADAQGNPELGIEKVFGVTSKALMPYEFIIDPASDSIDEALGVAHVYVTPRHLIIEGQRNGTYRDVELSVYSPAGSFYDRDFDRDHQDVTVKDRTHITEYQGLVPRGLLEDMLEVGEGDVVVDLFSEGDEQTSAAVEDDDMVEAIVLIANTGQVLSANENPLIMQDRGFVSYQHDTIPDNFHGRGVAEKGFNMQSALDGDLRGRMDAMALIVHPMMGMDVSRMPKNLALTIRPGQTIRTNGNPSEILQPLRFGDLSPASFSNAQDLERMHGQATGASDSVGSGVDANRATLGGLSMAQSSFIKRNNRTMRNMEEFIGKIIEKVTWRYMQFDSAKYPPTDIKFKVISTMGMIAREAEQQQLAQLLNTAEAGSTGYWILMLAIVENSSISVRDQMLPIIQQQLEQSQQPKQPSPLEQMQIQKMQVELQLAEASVKTERLRAQVEVARASLAENRSTAQNAKDESQAMLNLAKAEAEEPGKQLDEYQSRVDTL